ncbi:MAG: hypothetical protein DWQ04_08155 [Chloroflexi bacterium]|nr:MAG: hypothetical protein DWQ04_08155 [Chloroflexota bacterium]
MYGITLTIRPTGGLTFRRMPSAILHISTYPFLPPTTMSGWLRRLIMMANSGEYPNTAVKKPSYFALPSDYYVLGAYPKPFYKGRIHTTKRHGPMFQSKHAVFSRLYRNKKDEGNYEKLQLHTWEYLMVEKLHGYVLHENKIALEAFQQLVNYGSKIGKEGFAYLETVSDVKLLKQETTTAQSATLLPGEKMIGRQGTLYPLYRYQYQQKLQGDSDLGKPTPSAIEGFVPFWAGWADEPIKLDFWTDGEMYVPVALLEALYVN